MYFNNSTTWGRLYKQLEILDHSIYTQLDSITVIYVKIVTQHEKRQGNKSWNLGSKPYLGSSDASTTPKT